MEKKVYVNKDGIVAQLERASAVKPKVAGSSPVSSENKIRKLRRIQE
jgi:hypothetical protein